MNRNPYRFLKFPNFLSSVTPISCLLPLASLLRNASSLLGTRRYSLRSLLRKASSIVLSSFISIKIHNTFLDFLKMVLTMFEPIGVSNFSIQRTCSFSGYCTTWRIHHHSWGENSLKGRWCKCIDCQWRVFIVGTNPLHLISKNFYTQMIMLFMKHDANCDVADLDWRTPLDLIEQPMSGHDLIDSTEQRKETNRNTENHRRKCRPSTKMTVSV